MELDNQVVKQDETPVAEVKGQPVNQDVKQEVDSVPYSRLAQSISKNKVLEEKVSDYEKQAETQRQKELEKKGEYETLLNETRADLKVQKEKADEYDKYVTSRKDAILSTYDEDERDIVGELPLAKLERYHESKIQSKQKVGVDNSRGGNSMTPPKTFHEMSDEDREDPAQWATYLESFRRNK